MTMWSMLLLMDNIETKVFVTSVGIWLFVFTDNVLFSNSFGLIPRW